MNYRGTRVLTHPHIGSYWIYSCCSPWGFGRDRLQVRSLFNAAGGALQHLLNQQADDDDDDQYTHLHTVYIQNIIYIYAFIIWFAYTHTCLNERERDACIYIYIRRTSLVAPMQLNTNIIRGLVKRAQLLWNVRNFCETCTTAGKRAQHLWHVHNISETCTTSLKHAHIEYLKTLGGGGETHYAHICIYICI